METYQWDEAQGRLQIGSNQDTWCLACCEALSERGPADSRLCGMSSPRAQEATHKLEYRETNVIEYYLIAKKFFCSIRFIFSDLQRVNKDTANKYRYLT